MLHMLKLAVGVRDPAHLAALQESRAAADAPLRHRTRNRPRREAEILAGGSMYWVVSGLVLVRQRIIGVVQDEWEDGSPCTGLLLDSSLVRVAARAVKPFQGWRYLEAADAPEDLTGATPSGIEALPEGIRRALAGLALI